MVGESKKVRLEYSVRLLFLYIDKIDIFKVELVCKGSLRNWNIEIQLFATGRKSL